MAESEALFPVSSLVVIVGTSNDDINGKVGTVKRFDAPRRRYVVELRDSKRQFALKAKNVAPLVEGSDDESDDDMPDLVSGDEYRGMPPLVQQWELPRTESLTAEDDDSDSDSDDLPPLISFKEATASKNNNANDAYLDDLPELEPMAAAPVPSTKPPPTSVTKRCNVCSKSVTNNLVVLPACSHVFCSTCPHHHSPDLQCCIVCQKCDPTVASIQQLPYVIDLRDPTVSLQQLLLDEYICRRNIEVMEAIESKQQKEVTKLEKNAVLATRKAKETVRKVREMLAANNRPNRDSQTFKEAKAKLEE